MPSAPSQPTAGSAPSDHSGQPAERTPGGAGCAGSAFTQGREQPAGAGRPKQAAERLARAGATARANAASRPVAPAARPKARPSGPWTDIAPEALDGLDLDRVRWLDEAGYQEMINDPAWIESMDARAAAHAAAAAHAEREAATGTSPETLDAIERQAMAGFCLTTHASADLTAAAERAAAQRRTHEVTLVTIISELAARGLEAPDGLSWTDWLRRHDPSLTAAQAKAFVTVGTALTEARWARLRLLVATQQVTVGNAAQIIDFDTRNHPVADPDDLATALGDLTEQAPRLRPEELARLARHHTEQIRPPRDHDEDRLDRKRRDARGLWFTQPTPTGMVGLRATLDPEAAAILKAAIDPLAAPAPDTDDNGRVVTRDQRSAARRRLEALLAIVQRGVAAADGIPTTDKAKIVVLIDHDTLLDDVRGSRNGSRDGGGRYSGTGRGSGRERGSGTTLTGDVLSPGVVRRMACDAEIIPLVLGGDSEPLDLGRSRRLFTRAQRLALIARDQGCSFPGCTVPATWCDAHHVMHWRHGGPTT